MPYLLKLSISFEYDQCGQGLSVEGGKGKYILIIAVANEIKCFYKFANFLLSLHLFAMLLLDYNSPTPPDFMIQNMKVIACLPE